MWGQRPSAAGRGISRELLLTNSDRDATNCWLPRATSRHHRALCIHPRRMYKGRVRTGVPRHRDAEGPLFSLRKAMILPDYLVAQVREGRAVLFLGAGASREAKSAAGKLGPTSK